MRKSFFFFFIFLKITVKYIFYLPKANPSHQTHHATIIQSMAFDVMPDILHIRMFFLREKILYFLGDVFFRGCLWLGTRRLDTTSGSITVLLCGVGKTSILGSTSKPFPLSGRSHSPILIDVTEQNGVNCSRERLSVYLHVLHWVF